MYKFLIVGKNFSSLKDKILARGDDYILLQDILTTKFPDKKFKRRIIADFSSKESLLSSLDSLKGKVDGVITNYENYVLPAAWVADYLDLPGMPIESAEACTDKNLMREMFASAPSKVSPDYVVIETLDDLKSFASSHSYPIILKPANLSKSLLVTKIHNDDELNQAYKNTMDNIQAIYAKYAPGRKPKLLAEEFMEGPIFSVDAYVDSEGEPHVLEQVVDYQTGYDIGYDDNFHYSRLIPSKLPLGMQQSIRDVAAIGCKALGMRSSSAHIEIILTNEGPRIVEIGARNGGYRERMHGLANGLDILNLALENALGHKLDIRSIRNEYCAVLELFPKQPGEFIGIENREALEDLPSLVYFAIKQPVGKYIGKSSDGYKMSAIIILHNPDVIQFNKDLEFVNNDVFVKTRAA